MGRGGYKAYCPIQLGPLATHALVDSGNSVGNAMSWSFAQKLGLKEEDLEPDPRLPEVKTAKKNANMQVMGRPKRKLTLRLGGSQTKFTVKPLVIRGLTMSFNMSGPFLAKHQIDQLHSSQSLKVQGKCIPLVRVNKPSQDELVNQIEPVEAAVYVREKTTVPAGSAVFLPLHVPAVLEGRVRPAPGLVEPHAHFVEHTDTHPTLAALNHPDEAGQVWASVMNTTEEDITIPEGLRFGSFSKTTLKQKHERPTKDLQGRNYDWYVEKFKLRESPFLKDEGDMRQAVELLREFGDLFSENDEYGKTDLVEHAIHTTDAPPVKSKHRPINPMLEQELREQVDHWLKQDVIEPSNSPWSFPLLAVPKKNGKRRYVVDYRRLNQCTIPDRFPLPNISDNLSRMANSTIFSGIDGTGAFHVVSIRKEDREKTAFSTPWGLYQFKRMPFGLCNAPATYCRLVQKVLNGIPLSVAIPYLDDTCVHSSDLPSHLDGLRQVLQAHRSAGLTLQPEKCQLFREKIEYLGHEISKDGIAVPPEYTKVVQEWPEPKTVKEVRTFLGKVSYYRRFIPKFSEIAAPLTDLTKKQEDDTLEFDARTKEAFNYLKAKLLESPILAYPRFDSKEPFILDTDWSCDPGAIGGVLSQVQDGQERVIAYGAKKLNEAEKNYSSHKGELLAAIFFIRHWKYYLSYRPFILRTDHEALKWIRNIEEPKGMILRWLETLANHDFTVEFRPGRRHCNADALSRTTHADTLRVTEVMDDGVAALGEARTMPSLRMQENRQRTLIREYQEKDNDIRSVKTWLETGKWPSKAEIRAMSSTSKAYAALEGQLALDQTGVVIRKSEDSLRHARERPCLPRALQAPFVLKIHEEGGHRGANNTYEKCIRQFYFPGAAAEAAMAVQLCVTCQKNQPKQKGQTDVLVSSPIGCPFQKWSIDFVGPLPESRNGNSYILTAKDCFTRWVEAYPTEDMTAATVVRTLEKELFARYGVPDQVHSDQGTQFTSSLMKEVYGLLGIKGTVTPAYNPKSNPVERMHRDLNKLLRACVDDHPQDWEDFLPGCLLAMRTSRCVSTGFSPFAMVYGREAALPLDIVYSDPWKDPKSAIKHVNELRARLETAFTLAREQQDKVICRARKLYKGDVKIEKNDLVWLFTPKATSRSRKLATHWTGPWKVTEVLSPVLFRVSSGPWNATQVTITAGLDRLRKYRARDEDDSDGEELTNLKERDVSMEDEFVELPVEPEHGGGDEEERGQPGERLEAGGAAQLPPPPPVLPPPLEPPDPGEQGPAPGDDLHEPEGMDLAPSAADGMELGSSTTADEQPSDQGELESAAEPFEGFEAPDAADTDARLRRMEDIIGGESVAEKENAAGEEPAAEAFAGFEEENAGDARLKILEDIIKNEDVCSVPGELTHKELDKSAFTHSDGAFSNSSVAGKDKTKEDKSLINSKVEWSECSDDLPFFGFEDTDNKDK